MVVSKKFATFVAVMIINGMLLAGCGFVKNAKIGGHLTIGDIAFDVTEKYGYTVYIEENSLYIPYLVLTDDYNGNTLLLRRDLLDEPRMFNDYSSYYEESSIDTYLNSDFRSSLSADMQNAIVNSGITITEKSTLGVVGKGTKKINRDIFLLSCSETGWVLSMINVEGEALKYFSDAGNRIAFKNGEADSWWLRTPDTNYPSCPFGIGPDGSLGSGNAYNLNGVRPAFCVNNSMTIEENDKVIQGQSVLVFSFGN